MMRKLCFCAVALACLVSGVAAAQGPRGGAPGVQSMIQGDSRDKDQPIQIDAASLQVQDKNKKAIFTGDVQVVQGDTTMKCQTLVVYYGQEVGLAGADQKPVASGPKIAGGTTNAQNIRRIEALGGVTVVSRDQNASGNTGVYDLQTKTITLNGNVVVSQGENVIHGERVVVDTVTGNARVEAKESASTTPGRVRALIQPKGQGGEGGNMMTIGPGRTN